MISQQFHRAAGGPPMFLVTHRRRCLAILGVAVFLGSATAALAHHSFAIFDTSKTVKLNGSVTAFEWTNPHAYIEVDVAEDGAKKHWSVEMGSPSILMQSGWKFK